MSKFTRKHYRAIADTVRHVAIEADCSNMRNRDEIMARVRSELASMFARDSSRFDRCKFDRACEPDGKIWARKAVWN